MRCPRTRGAAGRFSQTDIIGTLKIETTVRYEKFNDLCTQIHCTYVPTPSALLRTIKQSSAGGFRNFQNAVKQLGLPVPSWVWFETTSKILNDIFNYL